MPSLLARLSSFYTRHRVKPALGDLSDIARVRRVFGARLPVPGGVSFEAAVVGGVPGEWVRAAGPPTGTLLYLHGGGFVGCSPRTHRPITAAFARLGWAVFVPDYRLAPEHPFPAALDDAVAAWRALQAPQAELAGQPARAAPSGSGRLAVAGDSAGGQLSLALMIHERNAGRPLPDAAALLSPATDLTGGSASLVENAERDVMFHGPSLSHLAQAYLQGADPAQVLASPLLADLAGLPPLIIHAAATEALRDDSTRLAAKAQAAGVRVRMQLWPGVGHVWQLLHWMPEARRSIGQMAHFLATAQPLSEAQPESVDVLIIGAGLSGIGAAALLQRQSPQHSVAIVEARATSGGTWDLFRYPGVRSDSDMFTLGYGFRPWLQGATLADGPAILAYVRQTARETGVEGLIRYGQRVVQADWDPHRCRWRVTLDCAGQSREIEARFINACAGYYRYDRGHRPQWPGESAFEGTWVHPQHWPAGLEVAGRRVIVIGSGATAVTLVPELARQGAQVTLLQRSPTYVMTLPRRDGSASALMKHLPTGLAWPLLRWRNILLNQAFYRACRSFPQVLGRWLVRQARRQAGPSVDAAAFAPRYAPWDQRLCIVPDGDLFQALRSGRAQVCTGQIAGFGPHSVQLQDGRELQADLIVTATGLELQLIGGLQLSIGGQPIDPAQGLAYKGVMFSGVPNFIATFGYTNASWTLKADLTARWMGRLLNTLERRDMAAAVPVADPRTPRQPFLDLSSGYVQRAQAQLPGQGAHAPWRVHQSHWRNVLMLAWAPVADRWLNFIPTRPTP